MSVLLPIFILICVLGHFEQKAIRNKKLLEAKAARAGAYAASEMSQSVARHSQDPGEQDNVDPAETSQDKQPDQNAEQV